jgi:hypothetical protein
MAVILNASTSSGFVQSADTSGEINLQSNGSTKLTVASTGVSGTIVQGTAVASTSGTSIDFTGIPSWAKRITVMFSGVSTTGSSNMLVQLGDSGGIENTGYVSQSTDGTNSASSTAGLIVQANQIATDTLVGQIIINNLTGNTWVSSAIVLPSSYGTHMGAGSKTTSATLDRIRITTVLGTPTFDAGTINIQYEG